MNNAYDLCKAVYNLPHYWDCSRVHKYRQVEEDIHTWLDSLAVGTEITLGRMTDHLPWVLTKLPSGSWLGFHSSEYGKSSRYVATDILNHLEAVGPRYPMRITKGGART